jgi:hypothetical protein
MDTVGVQTRTRLCSTCGGWYALDCFRRRRAGGEARHSMCRRCFAEYMRNRRQRLRDRDMRRFFTEMWRRRDTPSKVETVATAMISHFGGVRKFADRLVEELRAAGKREPGGRDILRGLSAIALVAVAASESQTIRAAVASRKRESDE